MIDLLSVTALYCSIRSIAYQSHAGWAHDPTIHHRILSVNIPAWCRTSCWSPWRRRCSSSGCSHTNQLIHIQFFHPYLIHNTKLSFTNLRQHMILLLKGTDLRSSIEGKPQTLDIFSIIDIHVVRSWVEGT